MELAFLVSLMVAHASTNTSLAMSTLLLARTFLAKARRVTGILSCGCIQAAVLRLLMSEGRSTVSGPLGISSEFSTVALCVVKS